MQRWVWVALPDVVDPALGEATVWTCDGETRNGDVALLYRATEFKDFAYVFKARTDARYDARLKREFGTDYACDADVVAELREPITLPQVRAEPRLANWTALLLNFHGSAFPISPSQWKTLLGLASPLDRPRLRAVGGG
jgi:predicted RNA-binding protein with PUA-like domain